MEEYCDRFEEWSALLPHLTEEVLENTFSNGLDPVIRTEMFCLEPIGLESMMRVAQKIEDRLGASKEAQDQQPSKVQKMAHASYGPKGNARGGYLVPTRAITLAEKVPFNKRESSMKRMTDSEY